MPDSSLEISIALHQSRIRSLYGVMQIILPMSHVNNGFPGGSVVKNPPAKQEMQVQSLAGEDLLE